MHQCDHSCREERYAAAKMVKKVGSVVRFRGEMGQ